MTTLARRATSEQRRIMRAVIGATKDVGNQHPEWNLHPKLGRSIAKRVAGTLLAVPVPLAGEAADDARQIGVDASPKQACPDTDSLSFQASVDMADLTSCGSAMQGGG